MSLLNYNCSSNDDSPAAVSEVLPLAPVNLTGSIINGQVKLMWTDNSNNETGFKIERKLSNGIFSNLGNVATNIVSYDDASISAGQTFVYRVMSYNSVGNSAYTNEISISIPIPITVPVLTTATISALTSTTSISGGNITSDGGATVTARGVVWSTSQNPTIVLTTKTTDGSGNGIFTSNISGLTANTQYFVRSYATLGTGSYAAKLCFDLVLNGYSDWYLPSRNEMSKMILNKIAIGGFSSANYWSSSEYDIMNAYYSNFTSGNSNLIGSKNSVSNVRAVRSF